jgi:hypothetical protein
VIIRGKKQDGIFYRGNIACGIDHGKSQDREMIRSIWQIRYHSQAKQRQVADRKYGDGVLF